MRSLFLLIKPDALERGLLQDITSTLENSIGVISYRLTAISAHDLISIYPFFCWDKDRFTDWVEAFHLKACVVGRVSTSAPVSYQTLNCLKGATFSPQANSIRGMFGATRISNLIHLPSGDTENDALESIFIKSRCADLPTIERVQYEMSSAGHIGREEVIRRLKERAELTGRHTIILDVLNETEPGSLVADILTRNYLSLIQVIGLPCSCWERLSIIENFCYPSSIRQ